jgi:uncharacterized protein involved in type VI secretion and phage assembly
MIPDDPPQKNMRETGDRMTGVALAIVHQNQDPEGLGRVKVGYPWRDHSDDRVWARVAVPMAGDRRGTYFIPEVGDEVLVAFERGDLRRPYVVGSLWSHAQPPPVTPDGKNDLRVIHSRKGHKLTFADGEESSVQLELADGKRLTLGADGIVVADANGNSVTIKSGAGEITIQASSKVTLKAPRVVLDAATVEVTGALIVST